tara:strand:+ start:2062 stop:4560 length:2499 start_codon:yes stop_codon:yes gene_type:complete
MRITASRRAVPTWRTHCALTSLLVDRIALLMWAVMSGAAFGTASRRHLKQETAAAIEAAREAASKADGLVGVTIGERPPLLIWKPDPVVKEGARACGVACIRRWTAHAADEQAKARVADAKRGAIALDPARADVTPIPTDLFGTNMEVTRHDIFTGLSAQLVANRLFASHDGVDAPRWSLLGGAQLSTPGVSGRERTYAVVCRAAGRDDADACGVKQARVGVGFDSGPSNSSAIAVMSGRAYKARLAVRTRGPIDIQLSLSAEGSAAVAFVHSFSLAATQSNAEWRTLEVEFVAALTTEAATLSITGRAAADHRAAVRWWLGAVSLLPADHVQGMRADVIALLQRIGFRGPVRWPGGCFASVAADWRDGLGPPDERPPFAAPPPQHFCFAVEGGLLGYTDGFAQNAPSIDEYMQLMSLVGSEPAIGLRLQYADRDDEVRRAAELVEYCNGDPQTTAMGRLRAARGHPKPYGVRKFYLGNEAGVQNRFTRDYKRVDGPLLNSEYSALLRQMLPALLRVDPSLRLISANGSPNITWPRLFYPRAVLQNRTAGRVPKLLLHWYDAILPEHGGQLWASSYHYYTRTPPLWTPETLTATAKLPSELIEGLETVRGIFDRITANAASTPTGGRAQISLDEWGIGPPWAARSFSAGHALYAATLLTMLCHEAARLGLASANYFEPINEGFITVGPFNASLTPMGEVAALYARHQQRRLLRTALSSTFLGRARNDSSDDLALLASIDDVAPARTLMVTVANRNAAAPHSLSFSVAGGEPCERMTTTLLEAHEISPADTNKIGQGGRFRTTKPQVSVDDGGTACRIALPPYSVAHLEIALR